MAPHPYAANAALALAMQPAQRWRSSPTHALRVDPLLVGVCCLAAGAAASVATAAALAGLAVGLLALRRQLGALALGLCVACGGLGWARASARLAEFARARASARALFPAPARCAATGRVTSSPVRARGKLRFDAELRELDCEGRLDARPWPARLYLEDAALPLARGDTIAVVADLALASESLNFELPDPRPASARRGPLLSGGASFVEITRPATSARALIDRARAHVRARIVASFAPPVAALARALVLGENDLDPGDEQAFQKSGLSHLLAVSGTHLILAVLALVRGLTALLRRWPWLAERSDVQRWAALLGLCLGPVYADFAGGSGSAWRAAWMLCAVLGVRVLGRHVFASRVLAAALALGWLGDGLIVFDPSFSLSMAATTGLLALGRRLETSRRPAPRSRFAALARLPALLSQAALTTLAATLPCMPILLSMSPGMSLASIAANLLAAPLGEIVALPLCLAHALSWGWSALEAGIALAASGSLVLIRAVAWAAASVDWLYVELPPPGEWHLAVLGASIPLVLGPRAEPWLRAATGAGVKTRREQDTSGGAPATGSGTAAAAARARLAVSRGLLCAVALLAVEAVTRLQHSASVGRWRQRLRVTALDVGQGDATLVDLPDGRLMLIDGGGAIGTAADPGERVILPVLRARRRDHLDIVVLTHPHPDHLGGLLAVAREIEIDELWYGGAQDPRASAGAAQPWSELLASLRARGVRLRSAAELCGHSAPAADAAGAILRVLHPCPADAARGENDNSLVLRITHGRRAALFMGDAEAWAEARLLATHASELQADFLKVGHHGSRTSSSSELLACVRPSFASISCGARNRFGHPHPEALARLTAAGAVPLPIDRLGAIQWQTDGETQELRSAMAGVLTPAEALSRVGARRAQNIGAARPAPRARQARRARTRQVNDD